MLPRLSRVIAWQGILSDYEVAVAIRDYRAGREWSGEAVNHYGGTRKLITDAVRHRRMIVPLLRKLDAA